MRPTSWLHLAMALSVAASLSACNCQRRAAIETPIAELQSCEESERCETGLCDTANGNPLACLRPCTQGCRGADICTQLPSGNYACVPEKAGLCKPCETDADCPQAADRCLVLGDTKYCGRDCSFDDQCPATFRCGEATTVTGALAPKQCQPTSGTCECIAATAGQQIPCEVSNASGTCSGISVCRPPVGYDLCTARTPTAEVCNGLDDDCNGMTDENLGDQTCGVGECQRSAAACANGTVQPCNSGLPSAELCNGRDDNCNGTVDDGFDTQTDVAHCGSCGTVCVLTNAVPKCELGACGVERCVAGWTDLDQVAANGCEYPCVSDGGMEICDGLDNDCDGTVDDGYDLLTDPTNCGQCNLACSVPGTTVSTYQCVARVCGINTCVSGRGNCNQQYGDGCETDLQADVSHCGQCGQACVTPNATPGCDAGQCGVGQCNNGFADCNLQVTDGCEVNTNTTVTHCGACGNVCDAANATDSCLNGVCTFACAANYWDADGQANNGCEYACIRTAGGVEACDNIDNDCDGRVDEDFDLTTSSAHCGQCNRACSAPFSTTACSASNCGITACDPNRANCNGVYVDGCEVNTNTDLANCGACNTACSTANATPSCQSGSCSIQSCNTGFANCNNVAADGCEINTGTDLTNCGTCGVSCSTTNGSPRCLGGSCGVQSCNPGYANCNNVASDGCEVNTNTELANCGACNAACTTPNASPQCSGGVCGIVSCNPGFTNCNTLVTDGCEVNTGGSDLANCGGCGTVCSTANATPRCQVGTCGIQSCNLGFANCNNTAADGCEINTNSDLTNCGTCGLTCTTANGSPRCLAGACGVQSCNPGFANCNNVASDGCEVNTATELANCGACNAACTTANATPQCTSGACGIQSCNPGYTNCNGQVSDGCEVNTGGSDLANCGGCGTVCSTANATPQCSAGSCGIQGCNLGFANCNGQVNDGCEINTNTSLANCGGCGTQCAPMNAAPVCVAGACGISACLPGFLNLNGLVADGCEYACLPTNGGVEACDGVDNDCDGAIDENFTLATDVNNCGACGSVCSAPNVTVAQCVASTCGVQLCAAGFANCNTTFADGCEVNTNTSLANCGGCNTVCSTPNANPVCTSGTCQVSSCIGSNRNCNSDPVDGCEVNVAGNVDACGLCGNVCPNRTNASRTCSGTTCGYACNAGFVDLDLSPANGCEYACSASGVDEPDDGAADQDCDGIDGTVSKGIFVASDGNDLNPGTRASPKRTVQAGINAASSLQPHVYVSEGIYDEALSLRSGISVYGGYSRNNNWARGALYVVTLRNGVISSGRIVAVSGTAIIAATTVAYVTIRALDTTSPGVSVYGLHCSGCTSLTLRNSLVIAGSAGGGSAGSGGTNGGSGSAGSNGGSGSCDGSTRGASGPGGTSACGRTGGAGGLGGSEGNNSGAPGGTGITGVAGGSPGGGGDPGGDGLAGANGPAGAAGSNGGGGSAAGAIIGGFFVVNGGNNGTSGNVGNGGGGGGGGGGQGCTFCNNGTGNGGGGGGAGGCPGTNGFAGTAGGSSFGVFLLNSTGTVVLNSTISSGNAGSGGGGGTGGAGGAGGGRGFGGTNCLSEIGQGGNGGLGGAGGNGGHGGGGAGGSSYGIYRSGSTVTLLGNSVTAGGAGFGGPSAGNVGGNGSAAATF